MLFNAKEDSDTQLTSSEEKRRKEITHIRQIEMSNEWDKIEQDLQNDHFWRFITNEEEERINRIEYIFDYIAERNINSIQFHTFNNIKDKIDEIKKNNSNDVKEQFWNKEVKKIYRILKEWYDDPELYNLIGFLNFCDIKIKLKQNEDKKENVEQNEDRKQEVTKYLLDKWLKKDSENNESADKVFTNKEEFKEVVRDLVRNEMANCFNNIERNEIDITKLDDDKFEYGKNNKEIKKILILFNILTLNKLNKKFAFEKYKFEEWEIEHIYPQRMDVKSIKGEYIKEWCESEETTISSYIEEFKDNKDKTKKYEEILYKIQKAKEDKNEFEDVYNEVYEALEKENGKRGINTIANLALIDRTTNSKFSNHFFDTKRSILIQIEKGEHENQKQDSENKIPYIPVCTRNVFLKFYNEKPKSLHFWSDEDKVEYKKVLVNTINNFMEGKEA